MKKYQEMRKNEKVTAIIYAFLAALFYALNVPCSKLLLDDVPPAYMAALLYLGAGVGVGVMYLFRRRREDKAERLARRDLPYTLAMVLLDVIAPVLLMTGLCVGSAANASLLGNFEIAATTFIAFLFFREMVSKRLWAAIALVTLSSALLSYSGRSSLEFSAGSLFVLGAAACWGLENNCTRSISGKSAYQIVTVKGIGSGLGSLVIALIAKEPFPSLRNILIAMALGFVAYGLSIFTYIRAQKVLGAARTSAYYAIAPFIGAGLSFVILKEKMTMIFIAALAIMLTGTAMIVYDTLLHRHRHVHTHVITHTHDGTTHTHIIGHSHEHNHLIGEGRHGHTHPTAELEKALDSIKE